MNAKELILQSKVQNVIVEFFEGVETIKSLKIEEKFGEKWKDTFFEQQDINYQKNKISIIFNSIISGGSTVYPLIIALLGYNMVNLSLDVYKRQQQHLSLRSLVQLQRRFL